MKNLIHGLCLAALLLTVPGCVTSDTGRQQIDPVTAEKLAPILSGSVAGAVVYAYSKNPKTEAIVAVVHTALNEFLLATNMSPAALQAKLYNLPVPELKTPEAQLIIAPLLAIYKGFADTPVKDQVEQNAGLKVLIQAMVDGLNQGLEGIKQMHTTTTTTSSLSDNEALKTIVQAMEVQMKVEAQRLGAS